MAMFVDCFASRDSTRIQTMCHVLLIAINQCTDHELSHDTIILLPVRWPSGLRRQLKVLSSDTSYNRWSERAWVQIPLSSIYIFCLSSVGRMSVVDGWRTRCLCGRILQKDRYRSNLSCHKPLPAQMINIRLSRLPSSIEETAHPAITRRWRAGNVTLA
jgi:hypothetical protein